MRTSRRPYIAMIFRCYAEALDSVYNLDRKGSGWSNLTAAFKIRDRITHPDTADQLEISDIEIRRVDEAFCFFWNSLMELWDVVP